MRAGVSVLPVQLSATHSVVLSHKMHAAAVPEHPSPLDPQPPGPGVVSGQLPLGSPPLATKSQVPSSFPVSACLQDSQPPVHALSQQIAS